MDKFEHERPAGNILASVTVDHHDSAARIAQAQAHAILALAEQVGRIADVLEAQQNQS